MEIPTMFQQYKDLVTERDKAILDSKKEITKQYQEKLDELRQKMHDEIDNQVRGFH